MRYPHDPLSKLRTVFEQVERAVIVDEYFLLGRYKLVTNIACVEACSTVKYENAFYKVWGRIPVICFLLHQTFKHLLISAQFHDLLQPGDDIISRHHLWLYLRIIRDHDLLTSSRLTLYRGVLVSRHRCNSIFSAS